MTVTNTTLVSESWNQLYSIVNANVTDPTGKSKFIYGTFPDALHLTKADYPLIVINPIASDGAETITISRGVKLVGLKLEIEVYSTSNSQLDTIANSVFDAIESNETTNDSQGLHNFDLQRIDSNTVFRGKTRVHVKYLDWIFDFHEVR
mgnify:CR=1 FL=1